MTWVIREFQPSDLQGCLSIMRSNTPTFFAKDEVDEFISDLEIRSSLAISDRWPYFVLVTNNQVRACGGYIVNTQREATLIWGMVDAIDHHKGLGTALFKYRIQHMRNRASVVEIDTTPASFGFYSRLGFEQTGYIINGYGQGLDKVLARLPI